jgi:integrase
LGGRKVHSVNRQDIAKIHHSLRETPFQANRVLALLSKMFNLSERWGLRPDNTNPCRHVERFKEKKRERYLSTEELARLGAALREAEEEGSELPSVITAIRLLIFTGARLSEILELEWENVDLEIGAFRVPDSKTGFKLIILGTPAMEVLKVTPQIMDNPYVCPGQKAGSHLASLYRTWQRIKQKANLKNVRPHDLRHSFASVGAGAGLGLPVIGALLGHKEAATTQRYAHLAADPLRRAADLISVEIDRAMKQEPRRGQVIELKKR